MCVNSTVIFVNLLNIVSFPIPGFENSSPFSLIHYDVCDTSLIANISDAKWFPIFTHEGTHSA